MRIEIINRPMPYHLKWIRENLKGNRLGRHIIYHPSTMSTNEDAFLLATNGEAEGTVVLADSQTEGKGRIQRKWYSPPGKNIYCSVILRPAMALQEASQIPLCAGVAVAEALQTYSSKNIDLKWPNDVLCNDKKVCGILSQLKVSRNKIDFIILGIGINVNMRNEDFPEEIRSKATSILVETGCLVQRGKLLIILFKNLAKWYKKLLQDGFVPVKNEWLKRSTMIGKIVKVSCFGELIEGEAQDIDESGSLILMDEQRKKVAVIAGDASIFRE